MKKAFPWWLYSLPIILIIAMSVFIIIHTRPGTIGVMLYYLSPLFITILAILSIIIGLIESFRRKPYLNRWRTIAFIGLLAMCFNNFIYGKYPSSFDENPSLIEFHLPLDTLISVGWGGGTKNMNYHVIAPDQCWAYDLLVMDEEENTHSGDSSILENYYCYGLPIRAPAKGKIIAAVTDEIDAEIGTMGSVSNPLGNHVIIEVATNEYLFICHMQPSSINVSIGDQIEQGQIIGNVGNSGHTSEPHIHIHLQSTKTPAIGEGIPMYFHNYVLDGNKVERGLPTGGFDDSGKFIGQRVKAYK